VVFTNGAPNHGFVGRRTLVPVWKKLPDRVLTWTGTITVSTIAAAAIIDAEA
jgi:hypothetical protein